MDNLKNVRISMFDRTNNSSQPVNVITSANAVIVDGEEKNIKEYVDSNNLINTHISPKVNFGKYTTESDLFGENINEVVSEFIQHYTGGGSNEPPVSPVPTLPMPGSTPAASATVPVEFTKRVEALETKLAAIESKGNSTSSTTTTSVSQLMFDCIEDIFPVQLDLSKFKTRINMDYEKNNNFVKSDIINIPELYYESDDYGNRVNENLQPVLCIKFKKDFDFTERESALNNLKINVYAKVGIKFTTYQNYKQTYQKYTYDKTKNLGKITGEGRNRYNVKEYDASECVFIKLTNQFIDESSSEFKYNTTFCYTSGQEYSDISDSKNLIIEMGGKSDVYKKSIHTCIIPLIITEYESNGKYGRDLNIEKYERETKSKNGDFLGNVFTNYGGFNSSGNIPESTKFDCINLPLPVSEYGIENVYVEIVDNKFRIHYLGSFNTGGYYTKQGIQKLIIALSNTIKMYGDGSANQATGTFKTIINNTEIKVFDSSINSPLSAGFQVTQRPIFTKTGVYFIYGPNIINYDALDSVEFTVEIPFDCSNLSSGPNSLMQIPITAFKERDTSAGEDHL